MAAALALAFAGCRPSSPQSGMLAIIRLDPGLAASCVVLEARSAKDSLLSEVKAPRTPGKDEYRAAILRGAFPANILLRARATLGDGCAEGAARAGESAEASEIFGAEVGEVVLEVPLPPSELDADRDGFIDHAQGGADCDDANPLAHPGAEEDCAGGVDLSCDGRLGCEDPGCSDKPCALAPVELAFASPPQKVRAGDCSAEVKLELRDVAGRAARLATDLPISLAPDEDAGFALFGDSECANAVTAATLPSRTSSAGFFFRGTRARSFTVSATSSELPPASQLEDIDAGPLAQLTFESDSMDLLTGSCSGAVRLAARDSHGNLTSPPVSMPVALEPADAGLTFFPDPGCPDAGAVVLEAGRSSFSFWFRGAVPGGIPLSASVDGRSASQTQSLVAQVRSAECTLDAGATQTTCAISPPLLDADRTLLTFQATNGDDATPNSSELRCWVASASEVSCSRYGTDGGATIRWQTAEVPSVRVQTIETMCDAGVTFVPIPSPVTDLAQSFVLSSFEQDGQSFDFDDFRVVRLAAVDAVEIQTGGCANTAHHAIEVVEFPGASVTRGLIAPALAAGVVEVTFGEDGGLPAVDPERTVLLYSYRGTPPVLYMGMCGRMLRGELPSPTTVRFSRALGQFGCLSDPIDAIAFERVELPVGTRVQQVVTEFDGGELSVDRPIVPVDLARSIAFGGSQGASGQGGGEGNLTTDDVYGAMFARQVLIEPGLLRLTRGTGQGQARFTTFVVELPPQ